MPELAHDKEVLDLVDASDKVVGTVTHDKVFDFDNNIRPHYLRAVNAFIISTDGRLWIPRRTADKKIAPNGLDFSVGEHVMSGESYIDAIVRGFDEELNMTINAADLTEFYKHTPAPEDPPYFNVNYLYHSDDEPTYNPKDFTEAMWLTPQEVIDRMQHGELGKMSLVPILQALLDYQAKR